MLPQAIQPKRAVDMYTIFAKVCRGKLVISAICYVFKRITAMHGGFISHMITSHATEI